MNDKTLFEIEKVMKRAKMQGVSVESILATAIYELAMDVRRLSERSGPALFGLPSAIKDDEADR